jgi:hypothetical protein
MKTILTILKFSIAIVVGLISFIFALFEGAESQNDFSDHQKKSIDETAYLENHDMVK